MAATTLESGPFISFATSNHRDYPAENILEGTLKSFWTSTGMFPQEFIVEFPASEPVTLKKLVLSCRKVGQIQFYYASSNQSQDGTAAQSNAFEMFGDQSLEDSDGAMQVCSAAPSKPISRISKLKIVIVKGHDAFCSIHRLAIQ